MIDSSTYLTKPFYFLSRFHGHDINNFRVKIGTVDLNQHPDIYTQTLSVADYAIHPDYKLGKNQNDILNNADIALLELQDPATLNQRVKIARIAEKRDRVGEHCVLAGWGSDSKGQSPEWLQEVRV